VTDRPARPPVRPGDTLDLVISDLAFGGNGVARKDGYAIFVKGALPGQTVTARITKRKKSFAEARIEAVLVPSPDQVEPECRHFGSCGGCLWQHLDYAKQAEAKARQVADCLARIGGLDAPPVDAPLAAPSPYGYRNKMEFSFGERLWHDAPPPRREPGSPPPREFGLGFHARGRFDRIVNIEECHLTAPWFADVVRAVRAAAEASGFAPYETRDHAGFFRFLVLREGVHTGDSMIHLVTYPAAEGSPEEAAALAVLDAARAAQPAVTRLLPGVTASRASVAFCESHRTVHGSAVIRERLLDDLFEIGPNTFFQTNTRQAEALFTLALEMAGGPVETAYDLYCGVGALTLPLSHRAARVTGVELIDDAVTAARRNAEISGRDNATFLCADMKTALTPAGIVDDSGAVIAGPPELIVVDPPRDGMHPDVVKGIAGLRPGRLVYVSCNPSTLARDAALLVEGGFRMERAVPVDMFPQTAHVEIVAAFTRA